MERHWTWSWCGRDIPHGFWRWAVCPCRIPCHRPTSGSVESLAGNRSFRLPCAPHLAPSPLIRRPRCSGPWPSCFPHRFDLKGKENLCKNTRKELEKTGIFYRRRNCRDGRADRTATSGQSPSFPAPDRPKSRGEHTFHLQTKIRSKIKDVVGQISVGKNRKFQWKNHFRVFLNSQSINQSIRRLVWEKHFHLTSREIFFQNLIGSYHEEKIMNGIQIYPLSVEKKFDEKKYQTPAID